MFPGIINVWVVKKISHENLFDDLAFNEEIYR